MRSCCGAIRPAMLTGAIAASQRGASAVLEQAANQPRDPGLSAPRPTDCDPNISNLVSAAFRAVEMGRITEALLDALDGVRWDETDQRWVGYLSVNRMRAKEASDV